MTLLVGELLLLPHRQLLAITAGSCFCRCAAGHNLSVSLALSGCSCSACLLDQNGQGQSRLAGAGLSVYMGFLIGFLRGAGLDTKRPSFGTQACYREILGW